MEYSRTSEYLLIVLQTQKELPSQFLGGQSKIKASLVIASFGASTGYKSEIFTLGLTADTTKPAGSGEKALRYGKLPEIHHIFRPDQKMPNILISTVFTLGAIAALPVLLGGVSQYRIPYQMLTRAVVVSWWQCQPPVQGIVRCAYCSCPLSRLHRWTGGYLVLVLFKLESLPNAAGTFCCWYDMLRQWQSSINRSTRPPTCWSTLTVLLFESMCKTSIAKSMTLFQQKLSRYSLARD